MGSWERAIRAPMLLGVSQPCFSKFAVSLALWFLAFEFSPYNVSAPENFSLEALQHRLDYTFRDAGLLECAVTHPSYLQEHTEVAEASMVNATGSPEAAVAVTL